MCRLDIIHSWAAQCRRLCGGFALGTCLVGRLAEEHNWQIGSSNQMAKNAATFSQVASGALSCDHYFDPDRRGDLSAKQL
jgi:hypothetical protein